MRLYDKIIRQSKINCERDQQILDQLKASKVFDISNITHLVGDWEEEKKHSIPKRPPYKNMWVEWDDKKNLQSGLIEYRCGLLLVNAPRKQMESWMKYNASPESREKYWERLFGSGWDEWYISQGFIDIKKEEGVVSGGRLRADCNISFYCMKNDSTEAEAFSALIQEDVLSKALEEGEINTLGLELFGLVEKDSRFVTTFVSAEVPLMACSLLHCRNVVTETVRVDDKLQKATIKRGHPRLCDYHVIKLRLNEHKVVGVRDEKGTREMRMHMVRGHFKNLQHNKYKEKGWHWWPAHVRGNPELGIVEGEYEMKEQ